MASGASLREPTLFAIRYSLFATRNLAQRKTPGSCLPGVHQSVRRSGSEVALNADVERDGVLVLELVDGGRLRSTGADTRNNTTRTHTRGGARILLVEVEPLDFRRERQVLDGGPTSDHTELRRVEVRIAGVGHALADMADGERSAVDALRGGQVTHGAVVTDRGVAAEQAGRPVGIPVVVECTTDTPGLRQLETAIAARGDRQVDGVGGHTDADALVSTGNAGAREHREVRRSRRGRDDLLGVAHGV